jgi:hypothetical protein
MHFLKLLSAVDISYLVVKNVFHIIIKIFCQTCSIFRIFGLPRLEDICTEHLARNIEQVLFYSLNIG